MATITNNTYYINDIYLPQSTGKFQETHVKSAIEVYEPEILQKLLGYELWNLLNTAWLAYPGTPLPSRFNDLINGADFSFEFRNTTINRRWIGLKNTSKRSIISYYVYFKYRNNTEIRTTSTGEGKTKKENTKVINPRPKLSYAYNRMVELYGETPKSYIREKTDVELIDFFLNQENYIHFNVAASCYNFLLANKENYPEWIFEPVFKINALGV